ncbi:MAG TPA: hypothetical protein VGZ24_07960 [Chthoniobacterales bacterium]|nr:hypothetical protein [Chthoniobacterales bacterium]
MEEEPRQTASHDARGTSTTRFWIATAVVILVVIAVWKFIDYRMRPPPPPPHNVVTPATTQ